MQVQEHCWRLEGGCEVAAASYVPDTGGAKQWIVFLPGLGDYFLRYEEWFAWLCAQGYAVFTFDWLGNGLSSGKRGDAHSVALCLQLLARARAEVDSLRLEGERLPALWAHSMGAFVALHALSGSWQAVSQWDWVFLSAPLLDPGANAPAWKRALAGSLATLLPKLSMDTGVRPEHCDLSAEQGKGPSSDSLWHHQISARFGASLLKESKLLEEQLANWQPELELFLLHGEEDPICEPKRARAWLKRLRARGARVESLWLPEIAHEPLMDTGSRARIQGEFLSWRTGGSEL